ncbi:unnamed protein product [Sympodiomycopsis kandeliae]
MSAPAATNPEDAAKASAAAFDVLLTKYKTAGEITSKALKAVIAAVKEGATVGELSKVGDEAVKEGTGAVYKSDKKLQKGSAFPTTISVNNVICNSAPLASSEAFSAALKAGDVVKIQLGSHIDGYPAIAAETVVVGASASKPVDGPAADAIKAAYVGAETAIRLLKPGAITTEISKEVEKAIKQFDVRAVEGMQTNQVDKDVIDGKKKIVLNPDPQQRPEAHKLEENEVFAVDISVTTSKEGKPKTDESATTIYKKTGSTYLLKMATSRKVFSEIQKKAGAFPFSIGALEDERGRSMGVRECVNHNLLTSFDQQYDAQSGAVTTQFFFTAIVSSKGAIRVTPEPSWYSADVVKSSKDVSDESLKTLLSQPVRQSAKKAKKAAAAAASA